LAQLKEAGQREFMMPRSRQHRPARQKAAALKKHLVEKVPVSDVCEEIGLQPSVFYTWQKQLFDNADKAFDGTRSGGGNARERELEAKIAALEAKLARKDAVIAEISEEHVKLKKSLGEP
jgi:transposase-like protein